MLYVRTRCVLDRRPWQPPRNRRGRNIQLDDRRIATLVTGAVGHLVPHITHVIPALPYQPPFDCDDYRVREVLVIEFDDPALIQVAPGITPIPGNTVPGAGRRISRKLGYQLIVMLFEVVGGEFVGG
ncbi:hypothetical protein D3C76_1497220 [compost metagenome]